jgi:WD40 repeat protein
MEMAYKAYRLNNEYGGYTRDAAIYDGLLSSLEKNEYTNQVYRGYEKIISLCINKEDKIELYTTSNSLITLSDKGYSEATVKEMPNSDEVRRAFIFIDYILLSTEKKKLFIIDRHTNIIKEINTHSEFVSTAAYANNKLYIGFRDGTMQVWEQENDNFILIQTDYLNDRITKLVAVPDKVFVGLRNGKILSWDHNNSFCVSDSVNGRVSAMAITNDSDYLIVGSSIGETNIYYMYNDELILAHSYLKSDLLIEGIVINQENSLIAVASSDNVISLYDLENFQEKPINITYSNKTIDFQEMAFNSLQQLIVCFTDNSIRMWETNNEAYAKLVKGMLPMADTKNNDRNAN